MDIVPELVLLVAKPKLTCCWCCQLINNSPVSLLVELLKSSSYLLVLNLCQ